MNEPEVAARTSQDTVPAKRIRIRGRRTAWALLVLVMFAAALDPIIRVAADHSGSLATGGCAHLEGTNVGLDPWPTADRALGGSLNNVNVAADGVEIGPVVLRHVRATIGHATYPWWDALFGHPGVDVSDGQASATLTDADMTALLQARGVPGTVAVSPGSSTLELSVLGFQVPLTIEADHGALSVSLADSPLLSAVLPHLTIGARGFDIVGARPSPGGLVVTATFSGQATQLVCAVKELLT